MVHLVLDADGQQAFGLNLTRVAVFVQGTHLHGSGALYAIVDTGHGQAAFFADLLFFAGPEDFRVDQHQLLVTVLRYINDDQTLMKVHLRCRQTNAIGLVHGLKHVFDLLADALIHLFYRFGHLVQTRIGIAKNGK